MNYSDDFKTLIATVEDRYIGHGNPNAKILIIGQEPALDRDKEKDKLKYEREIAHNREEWNEIVSRGEGYERINEYQAQKGNPDFFSPLHPWPLQKYQIRSGAEEHGNLRGEQGTARTWYIYQKLINLILGESLSKEDLLTFHRKSFHTDMSDAAYREHDVKKGDTKGSVFKRKELLKHPFFNKFHVVIAMVGNFPAQTVGNEYFGDVFSVLYKGDMASDNLPWINVSVREGDNPLLLIHCRQASAPLCHAYFARIAEIVKHFAQDHGIDLNPEM